MKRSNIFAIAAVILLFAMGIFVRLNYKGDKMEDMAPEDMRKDEIIAYFKNNQESFEQAVTYFENSTAKTISIRPKEINGKSGYSVSVDRTWMDETYDTEMIQLLDILFNEGYLSSIYYRPVDFKLDGEGLCVFLFHPAYLSQGILYQNGEPSPEVVQETEQITENWYFIIETTTCD